MLNRRAVLTIVLMFLSGCSALPSAGPTTSDVVNQSQSADGTVARYNVVDIDPRVVEVMRSRFPAGLRARFGDYRPSPTPLIVSGDTVTVAIWEASSNGLFSSAPPTDRFTTGAKSVVLPEQAVGRDGSISVPYAGRLHVAGLSTESAQHKVEAALEGKAIQPQVLVSVSRPVGNSVTVTGEVGSAARVPLSNKGDRLLDVLAGAGGVRISVDDAALQLARGPTTASVRLTRVLIDPRENIFMRPGDSLTVIRRPLAFMAVGASGRNVDVPFSSDKLTLSEAMAKMGGLLDARADPAGVFVFRYEPSNITDALLAASAHNGIPGRLSPVVYRLNLRDPNSLFISQRFPIFDRDVVYVSDAPITDVQKVFSVVGGVVAPAARVAGAAGY